jgi:hypothetical protein
MQITGNHGWICNEAVGLSIGPGYWKYYCGLTGCVHVAIPLGNDMLFHQIDHTGFFEGNPYARECGDEQNRRDYDDSQPSVE